MERYKLPHGQSRLLPTLTDSRWEEYFKQIISGSGNSWRSVETEELLDQLLDIFSSKNLGAREKFLKTCKPYFDVYPFSSIWGDDWMEVSGKFAPLASSIITENQELFENCFVSIQVLDEGDGEVYGFPKVYDHIVLGSGNVA
jgi:hypothetical protein